MDAQDPIGGTGQVRRQTTRACYPDVGIELEIGETPVLQCSRWYPVAEPAYVIEARDAFIASDAGQAFAGQVAEFETACQGEPIDPSANWALDEARQRASTKADDLACAAYAREFASDNGGAP